ncbi:MAG: membrane protein insertion efficiency factor YidD [Ilumatobacteraceae bacterium]
MSLAPAGGSPWTVRAVRWYQRQLAGRPSPCRFTPTCSEYAVDAFTEFGTLRGGLLTLRRLFRCRPFGPSGWDPVPARHDRSFRKDHT